MVCVNFTKTEIEWLKIILAKLEETGWKKFLQLKVVHCTGYGLIRPFL